MSESEIGDREKRVEKRLGNIEIDDGRENEIAGT